MTTQKIKTIATTEYARDAKGVIKSTAFSSILRGVENRAKSQRADVQFLLEEGLKQYDKHGNTVYLTKTMDVCMGVRSLPTKSIKDYIKAHANVVWTKNKDGNMVFAKASKNAPVQVTMPTQTWWEHSSIKQTQATGDIDAIARLKTAVTTIKTALTDGKVKAEQVKQAEQAVAALESILA